MACGGCRDKRRATRVAGARPNSPPLQTDVQPDPTNRTIGVLRTHPEIRAALIGALGALGYRDEAVLRNVDGELLLNFAQINELVPLPVRRMMK